MCGDARARDGGTRRWGEWTVGTKYGIVSFSKHAGQGDGVNGYEILLSGLVAVPTAYGLGFWRGRRRRAQAEYLAAEEHQGEVIVRQTLTQHFSLPGYHLFNHLTLPAQDGTTEVDHVLVARTGIFVIEVKHYSGVITASREARRWIQRWPRRPEWEPKSHQNPLNQNFLHLKTIQAVLDFLPETVFHSLIVFTGTATFDTAWPPYVYRPLDLVHHIKQRVHKVMTMQDMHVCVGRLEYHRRRLSYRTDVEHQAYLVRKFGEVRLPS
jgi:hypothetical protein